jgi:hypothetical protein
MGIEQQVYLKSDRRGRLLILTFCIAPLVVPLVTIGAKFALVDGAFDLPHWPAALSSSAQASAPPLAPVTLGALPSRDAFHSTVFAGPSEGLPPFEVLAGETRVL